MFKSFLNSLTPNAFLVVKYKIKKHSKIDIPDIILKEADGIVKFDLFAFKPEIIKTTEEFSLILKSWEEYSGIVDKSTT